MPTALDPELAATLQALQAQGDAEPLPFVVTLAPGARAADVVPFTIEQDVPLIRMVSGRMSAAQALVLAQRTEVQRIEFDGTAQALAQRLRHP